MTTAQPQQASEGPVSGLAASHERPRGLVEHVRSLLHALSFRLRVKWGIRFSALRRSLGRFAWDLEHKHLPRAEEMGASALKFDVVQLSGGSAALAFAKDQPDGARLDVGAPLPHSHRLAEYLSAFGVRSLLLDVHLESNQFTDVIEVLLAIQQIEAEPRSLWRPAMLREMAQALRSPAGMHHACAATQFDAAEGQIDITYTYCQTLFSKAADWYKERSRRFRDHRAFFLAAPRYATVAALLTLIPNLAAMGLLVYIYIMEPNLREEAHFLFVLASILVPLFEVAVWLLTFTLFQTLGSVEYDKEAQAAQIEAAHMQLTEAMSRLQVDINMAAEIQRTMLPKPGTKPFAEHVTIVPRFRPEMAVGGDLFDFKAVDDQHLGVVLADVSGHGLQAAFVTGLVKTSFELNSRFGDEPAQFMASLNRTLCRLTPPTSFATVIHFTYDIRDRELLFVNGGHAPFPILIVPDGHTAPVSKDSDLLLGLMEDETYHQQRIAVAPGTKLLVCTDGLVDAVDESGGRFGYHRLLDLVSQHASASATQLDAVVFEELAQFTKGAKQNDDIAALTLEFH